MGLFITLLKGRRLRFVVDNLAVKEEKKWTEMKWKLCITFLNIFNLKIY